MISMMNLFTEVFLYNLFTDNLDTEYLVKYSALHYKNAP